MNKLLDWFKGARWRLSLSHCLEALPIQILVAIGIEYAGVPKSVSWWVGMIAVTFWFWSREKAQYEQRIKEHGTSNADVWNKGIWPGDWGSESVLDLVYPVVSSSLIAAGMTYWVMHR